MARWYARTRGFTGIWTYHRAVAWDASRPVPFKRLVKEWVIYAAIMAALFLFVLRDSTSTTGLFIGLGVSLPLYVGLSYVMAKFGYQRKSLAELRTPRATPASDSATPVESSTSRNRPAPTRRTSSGPNRPTSKKRR